MSARGDSMGGRRGRGRGGGRGGGVGRDDRDRGRGSAPDGGRGRGSAPDGGRGRGLSHYSAPAPSSAPSPVVSSPAPQAASVSASSTISGDFERKLTLGSERSGSVSTLATASGSGGAGMANVVVAPPASSKAIRFPQRPNIGTIGRKVVVKANHFLVQIAEMDLHHYDVSITPEVRSKKVCRDILNQLQENYRLSHLGNRLLAYDGLKNAYTVGELPFNSKEFVINFSGERKERKFKISIKFAARVDIHHLHEFLTSRQLNVPQETIQALDVILRETPSNMYEVVGRSFFHPSLDGKGPLGNGVEYWRGFYQSIRPTQMGLSLNMDVSARGFYEPIMVNEFVGKFLNKDLSRPLSDEDRNKVKRALKNVKVEVAHTKHVRRYKISGITVQPLSQLSFSHEGTDTTIEQYFRQKYNVHLRNRALPALISGPESKLVYLPMEVCKIVEGQRYSKKLNERQVASLLDACCQRPKEREFGIKKMVGFRNFNGDRMCQEFGVQIRNELTSIEARVLPPPMLKYHETGGEPLVDPRVGVWNMINKKMVNGARVDHWACVNFSRNVDPHFFCKELIDMCSSKGMVFNPKPVISTLTINPGGHGQIEKTLIDIDNNCRVQLQNQNIGSKQLQLLILILPDISGSYGTIKRVCETELGIVSQCCHPRKASRLNKQYLENVALKINVKVGGRNAVLQQAVQRKIPFLTDCVTIVFGADVTHPQPGEDSGPSIAAVVASMDWPEVTKYRALVSAQYHRQEMIQDLYKTDENGTVQGGMIREHLRAFRRSTGHKPDRIIFYRDGVSEGQFNEVLLYEMDAIRKACLSLEANYLPRVTFVVVQKRHHTRLFTANHQDYKSTDKSGNILPGTVVDTKICHPTEFDFYLCSHSGIKGTSRPVHYHVLYDENRFNADALQMLTYHLCYTYARCTRAVSIVPPAYYAHLAAFRARYYIEGEYSDGASNSNSGGRLTREQTAVIKNLPAIKDNVKDVMFYC